ncbi:hypothetical protein RND71_023225 [Anisodus tanguticus]|uniref:Uncharacterized protein n=1 Tax=Anisodus tanguticus TaxID=243964 RepID=A0AAE1RU05_9SOLA|nr:hypothetical protein RND71_023225 [Anisodus tanguticus]
MNACALADENSAAGRFEPGLYNQSGIANATEESLMDNSSTTGSVTITVTEKQKLE